MLNHTTEFYKNLFGPEEVNAFSLDGDLWDPGELVDEGVMTFWPVLSSKKKSKQLYSKWKKNKAVGPDSMPVEFFQSCWEIVKDDIVQMFDEFYRLELDVSRHNYDIITLLPKVLDAEKIQQYRPIC